MIARATTICGIDEVGRGCLAGDVYACAVVFHSSIPQGMRDSKAIAPKRRYEMDHAIRQAAHVAIGIATVEEIDAVNILAATMLAMRRAYDELAKVVLPDLVIVDGNRLPDLGRPHSTVAVIGGDALNPVISAASIAAKVARDRRMAELHVDHPDYAWDRNMGYGSPAHLSALACHGPTCHHRLTFAPVRAAIRA